MWNLHDSGVADRILAARHRRASIRSCFTHRIINAGTESIHAMVRSAKWRAGGFQSSECFRIPICFRSGGRDLRPSSIAAGS
jgi:hypothetical protein